MKFVDIIKKDGVLTNIISEWNTVGNKSEYIEKLNSEHGVEWSYACWSRYLNLLSDVLPMLHTDDVLIERELKLNILEREIRNKQVTLTRMTTNASRYSILYSKFKSYFETTNVPKKKKLPHVENNITRVEKLRDTVFIADIHHDGDVDYTRSVLESVLHGIINSDESALNNGYTTRIIVAGDVVQGYLRIDDIFNDEYDPIKQAVEFSKIFFEVFKDISEFHFIKGNHDELRVIKDLKGQKVPSLLEFVKAYGEALGHVVHVVDKVAFENTCTRYEVIHGHEFRGKKKILDYYKNYDKKLIHAHYHHFHVTDNVIGLPSLAKPNSYEKSLGIVEEPPKFVTISGNDSIKLHTVKLTK